jgi:hypothetical protein
MSEPRIADELKHRVVRQETCSLATVRRVAAMLDQDPDPWSEGDALPPRLAVYSAWGRYETVSDT